MRASARWRRRRPAGRRRLIDVVLAADTERTALLAEAEAADGLRRAEIETRLTDIGAHAAPARAAAILHGLGFDAEAQERPCSSFSGGWRMRVALAAVLFAEPDLLLLDEPTNYLDLEGTLWLYDYLARYPHTVLIISHDRELLDTASTTSCTSTAASSPSIAAATTSFARQLAEKQALQAKLRVKQEAERKHLQAFVDRFRAKASKARQAQSRVKRLAKLEPIAALVEDESLPFQLPEPERPLAPPLVAMEGVAAGYGDRAVLDRLNLTLAARRPHRAARRQRQRQVHLLQADRRPARAADRRSQALRQAGGGLFRPAPARRTEPASHRLRPRRGADAGRAGGQGARPRPPRFGFPGAKADTPVSALSGGEKARLLMGLAAFDGPHLLILDEPTNHLDIDSRAALMEAINDYEGAVILVSHDRFLIEACADRLWLVANGTVKTVRRRHGRLPPLGARR